MFWITGLIIIFGLQIRGEPPRRPGNFNMPKATASTGKDNTKTEDNEGDPLLPTINVHYNYKPQDWVNKERTVNEMISLRRDFREACINYLKNRNRLNKFILQRKLLLKKLLDDVLKIQQKKDAALPTGILTGSIADDPVEMSRLRNLIIKEWEKQTKKINKATLNTDIVENNFRSMEYPFHMTKDIYTHLSDQFIAPSSFVQVSRR